MATTQNATSEYSPLILDVFGQQPGLSNLYTQLTFIYSLPETNNPIDQQTQITRTLTNGLERLSSAFPWIAGQVLNTTADLTTTPPNSGVYYIAPFNPIPDLVVKDSRDDENLSIHSLRASHFPFAVLHESILCPRTTLHLAPTPPDTSPVLVLQATFVQGGMLLSFVAQHNVMDMTSQAHFIRLFDKACRGENFTSKEITEGNMDREHVIPLLSNVEETNLASKPVQSTLSNAEPLHPPTCTWEYFSFSSDALASMKAAATDTLPPSCPFVSTDDVLTAFIWKHITRARIPRLSSSSPSSTPRTGTIGRAIDPRRFIGLSETYPGLVQNMTYHTFPAIDLVDMTLGAVAAELRGGLTKKVSPSSPELAISHWTKAFATRLASTANKNIPSVTSSLDLTGYDLMLSSWANQGALNDLTFGLADGVQLEAIRRPSFTPVESLLYLLPRAPNGEILLGTCLRDDDMKRLKDDTDFGRWAKWVG